MNYKALMHPNYAHTYGVINYARGEIITIASDIPRYALRAMLRRFYHELREARAGGYECRVALFNCGTEQILMEGEYQVPEYVLDAGFKTEKKFWDTLAKLCDELEG
jgi:hypothetical protein